MRKITKKQDVVFEEEHAEVLVEKQLKTMST